MVSASETRWVCAQLGSREHYAIPRVLHESGRLGWLLTDFWAGPTARGATGRGSAARMAQRFHPALASARVEHLGMRRVLFDLAARAAGRSGWHHIIARNAWFERSLLRRLERHRKELAAAPGVFFAYSYAARDLLRFFRTLGWKTVLGQIDPGWIEEEIVAAEHARHPEVPSRWKRAPAEYWQRWREECALADLIVVNSPWSRTALGKAGIPLEKIRVVPLAFSGPATAPPPRVYPERFEPARPLRVLFLGQLVLRKGIHFSVTAARRLAGAPVEWRFVGPAEVEPPADLVRAGRVRWSGPVPRAQTAELYREADVFLLPTLSDGFALTQLEAQAARLPLLASRYCGAVVRDGENGWIIDPLDADGVTAAVQRCLEQPAALAAASSRSGVGPEYSLEALRRQLDGLQTELLAR